MRFEIEDRQPNDVVILSLEKNEDDDYVDLVATESNGITWHVLTITEKGTIALGESVADNIGFQVDDNGRVIIENDED